MKRIWVKLILPILTYLLGCLCCLQAESASLYGESEDYTRPVLHPVRSWGPREVVREQPFSVIHEFDSWRKSPELAEAVAAIKALTAVIKRSEASTMMGLEVELKTAADALKVEPACENLP